MKTDTMNHTTEDTMDMTNTINIIDTIDTANAIDDIRRLFLAELTATPAGRRHLLSISVDAEEGDEGEIFEQLADIVEDPKLRRIVVRHRDDEARHAQLFRDCLSRLGLDQVPTPDEMKIVRRIADATGGFEQGVHSAADVVATYAMLLAIEERGVEQFPLIADAFDAVDPETAAVYRRVARDERGHVRYCETIGRHYAGSDEAWRQAVAEARVVEASVFLEVGLCNLAYCAARGWTTSVS